MCALCLALWPVHADTKETISNLDTGNKDISDKDTRRKDAKDTSSKSPDATQRKASPRGSSGDSKGAGAGKKTTGKKKAGDAREGASTPPPPEPQSMVAVRPLVLRKTIELNSDKLGEVPVGTALLLLETRDGDSGAKRGPTPPERPSST